MTDAGTAFVGLEFKRGDLASLESQNAAAGKRFTSGWLGAAKSAALGIGAAFGAVKVVDFLGDTITAASDLNETMTKTQVVFGDSADAVIRFGQGAATSLGQSTNQAIGAAAQFGNLFRALKIGETQSAGMSTRLVQLAGDLASFNNVDPAEALDALRSGLVGETEPLRRFGVNMNDATLRAEALKLGLLDAGDTGGTALDPAIKAQAAYALILDQTKLAQGDFARTSGGLANQQRILGAQWENLKATIGGAFLPVVVQAVSLMNRAIPTVEGLGGAIGAAIGAIAGSGVGQAIGQTFGAIGSAVGTVAGEIGRLVGYFQSLHDAGIDIGTALESTAIVALEDLGVSAGTAVGVVSAISGALGTGRDIWNQYGTAILGAAAPALAAAANFETVRAAVEAVVGFIGDHQEVFGALGGGILFVVGALVAYNIALAITAAAQVAMATSLALMNIALAASPIGLAVIAIVALAAAVIYLYRNNETARAVIQAAFTAIKAIVVGAANAIIGAIRLLVTVGTTLWRTFGGAITTIARAQFQTVVGVIRGVLKVVEGVINVALGLITGDWSRAWHGIQQITSGILGIIRSVITGFVRIFYAAAHALGAAILNGVKAGIGDLAGFVRGKVAAIPGALGNVSRLLFNAGVSIVQGLIDGIGSMFSSLADKASELASVVTDHLPFSPAKKGPLRDHPPDESGRAIVEMLAGGIDSSKSTLARSMTSIAGLAVADPATVAVPAVGAAAGAVAGIAPVTGGSIPEVRVFIGDRELADLVRVEVHQHGREQARQQRGGRRWS